MEVEKKIDPRKAREAIELLKSMGLAVPIPKTVEEDKSVFEEAKAKVAELEQELEAARQEAQAKAATLYGFGLLSDEDINKFVIISKRRGGGGARAGSMKRLLWEWIRARGSCTRAEVMDKWEELGGARSGAPGVYLGQWMSAGALTYDAGTGIFKATGKEPLE